MLTKSSRQLYLQSILLVSSFIDIFNVLSFHRSSVYCKRTISEKGYNVSNWWSSLPTAEKQVQRLSNQREEAMEMFGPGPGVDLNVTLLPIVEFHQSNQACYADLGCITRFSFADPLLWPINLLPESRTKINTHFTLYTRENSNPQPLVHISADDPNGIAATTFKATRPTKFFIHGWRNTGYEELFFIFVQRFLVKGDYNIIRAHWGGGSRSIYFQSHANTRLVGLEIALLVNTMVEKLGVQATDVHLIGHSLGAHTAGYAGENIRNLGQITGLDPAGPYFHGLPSFARLDHTDANFVDVVHTNAGSLGFGIVESSGHLDFRPNGGKHQPGCQPTDLQAIWNDPTAIVSDASTCDHMRSVRFYSESLIPTDCSTVGYECSNYESFNNGLCTSCGLDNNKCAPFGLEATSFPTRSRKNVNIYFKTGGDFPYCRYQYLIKLSLGKTRNAKPTISGELRLSVNGHTGILPNIQMPKSDYEHGKDYRFLAAEPTNVGPVNTVNLRWFPVLTNLFDPTCFLGFCDQRMYVKSVNISLLNRYPDANKIANTFENCPVFGPAAIGPLFNTELSVSNNCSLTFPSLVSILIPGPWIVYKK